MKIGVDAAVFALAPEFTRYVLVAEGVRNAAENEALLALLRQEEASVRANDAFADLKAHPRLASWRDMFASFGVNANKCPPSVFNLIKRVRGGKDMPFVNSLVAIFNILSMRHVIPAGGDDLDTVIGDISLRAALGSERYIPLGGARDSDAVEHPQAGEIVLVDTGSATVLCRAWCWKNGDTTKIEAATRRVAINLDILPPVAPEEGRAIAEAAKALIETHCGAAVVTHRLDAANRELTVAGQLP